MAQPNHTPRLAHTEEALTVLFCLVDDAYAHLNPRARRYESLKRLADSEVIALALFQQLRGVESERSFLRDAQRFFSHLFPGVVGLHPSSFHRRVRRLRRFLEPLRRAVLPDLVNYSPLIREYETVGAERTPDNPLGRFRLTPERIRFLCQKRNSPRSALPPRSRAERYREPYAMLGLEAVAHKDGTPDIPVRGSKEARSLRPGKDTKGGVMPWDGSGSPSTTCTPT